MGPLCTPAGTGPIPYTTGSPYRSFCADVVGQDKSNETHSISELPQVPKIPAFKFKQLKKMSISILKQKFLFNCSILTAGIFLKQGEFRDIMYLILDLSPRARGCDNVFTICHSLLKKDHFIMQNSKQSSCFSSFTNTLDQHCHNELQSYSINKVIKRCIQPEIHILGDKTAFLRSHGTK